MSDILEIIRTLVDSRLTWQETLVISLFITGFVLVMLILTRCAVAIVAHVVRSINAAVERFKPK